MFSDLGIPSIIQRSEFLGYVTKLAKVLNVKMIHSSPRHLRASYHCKCLAYNEGADASVEAMKLYHMKLTV